MGQIGVWGAGVLLGVAILAPALASDQPIVFLGPTGWRSPWLQSLFDRSVYPSAVDVVFNALLVPGALIAAAALALRARRPGLFRGAAAIGLGMTALLLAVLLAFPFSRPYVDWSREPQTVSVTAPIPFSARSGNLGEKLQRPSGAHLLGTDKEGRDTLTRLLFGARVSLSIGVLSVAIYCTAGTLIGAVAGFLGGRADLAIQGLIEVVMCVPSMFVALAAAAFIEHRSVFHVVGIIAALHWTGPARLVRAEVLRLRNTEFVLAARAAGFAPGTILLEEILPNAIGPVLVSATFGVANAILIESGMSFLGLGDASSPSWGQMLASGRGGGDWLQILAPGGAIFVTVILLNIAGETVRDALDPRGIAR